MRALAAGLALAAAGLIGCGGDGERGEPEAPRPAAEIRSEGRAAVRDVNRYCARRTLGIAQPRKAPTVREQARALEAVDLLIALAAENPSVPLERGVRLGPFLGDLTENLEGSNCDPAIVSRLAAGVDSLPPP